MPSFEAAIEDRSHFLERMLTDHFAQVSRPENEALVCPINHARAQGRAVPCFTIFSTMGLLCLGCPPVCVELRQAA
eukprot:6177500-Prymnesium_polylepis.1